MKAQDFIRAEVAAFMAQAELNRQRTRCDCDQPVAGVFHVPTQMTTCQRCGKRLSYQRYRESRA